MSTLDTVLAGKQIQGYIKQLYTIEHLFTVTHIGINVFHSNQFKQTVKTGTKYANDQKNPAELLVHQDGCSTQKNCFRKKTPEMFLQFAFILRPVPRLISPHVRMTIGNTEHLLSFTSAFLFSPCST